jgi:hypothetical protein
MMSKTLSEFGKKFAMLSNFQNAEKSASEKRREKQKHSLNGVKSTNKASI